MVSARFTVIAVVCIALVLCSCSESSPANSGVIKPEAGSVPTQVKYVNNKKQRKGRYFYPGMGTGFGGASASASASASANSGGMGYGGYGYPGYGMGYMG